jgi:DNA-binding NarL/FixJ family response regulator
MGERIGVLIVDDHPVVRQGLRTFIGVQDDMEVVGEAGDGDEAVEMVAALAPDVVLLDLKMPRVDGFAALRRLAERGLAAKVLVLTSMAERANVLPAVRAGADGYLFKDVDPRALAQAIRAVHDGHVLLAPNAAAAVLGTTDPDRPGPPDAQGRPGRAGEPGGSGGAGESGRPGGDRPPSDDPAFAALTAREREVLAQIALGRGNREIARSLSVSEKTVKTHVSSVLMKLGVHDRTQAALYAVRRGLPPTGDQ